MKAQIKQHHASAQLRPPSFAYGMRVQSPTIIIIITTTTTAPQLHHLKLSLPAPQFLVHRWQHSSSLLPH